MPTDLKNVVQIPRFQSAPPPAPARQRSTRLIAGVVAAAVAVVGAGIWWNLRPSESVAERATPVMLRMAFSPGSSYGFRVEANTSTTLEIRGEARDFTTGMQGTLRIGAEDVGAAWAEGHGDLSVLSFVANGAAAPDAFRVRHPMRLSVRGPVTKGLSFATKDRLPLLDLPLLTPVLPAGLVAPGEVWTEEATFWGEETGATAEVFTEFEGYETSNGIRYAVVHGTVSIDLPEDSELGWGRISANVTAHLDPEGRRLLASAGTVQVDLRTEAPEGSSINRIHVISDSEFTLSALG
jgi:hypothetical protein